MKRASIQSHSNSLLISDRVNVSIKASLLFLVCDLASKDSQAPFVGQNVFVFKVPLVGTLNLCLKMPNPEQKTRTQYDQHGLRNRPKTAEICKKLKIGIFHQFFDVFSAQDDRIEF